MAKEIRIAKRDFYIFNILFLLSCGRGNFRYSEIRGMLKLKDSQTDHGLKLLRKHFLIIACIIPTKKGRIFVEYRLSKRGKTLLKTLNSLKKYSLK